MPRQRRRSAALFTADFVEIRVENGSVICNSRAKETVLLACKNAGFFISAPCGGEKRCGKCKVELLEGRVTGDTPDENGKVRACCAVPLTDITIACDKELFPSGGEIPASGGNAAFNFTGTLPRAAAAVDIGTTTVSAQLVNPDTAQVIDTISQLNDQRVFGADVMSRINNAKKSGTHELFSLINRQTERILKTFIKRFNISKIEKLSVSGNTVMLHLFLNADPSGMGKLPFTPVFLEEKILKGEELCLSAETAHVLPSVSAFIGADIASALASLDILSRDGPSFYVDLGTNAEMALINNGNIICCSAAAGPAFESADNSLSGCALIDAICEMLAKGIIDETGIFNKPHKEYCAGEGIYVTAKDIRNLQLAKSAIISGIKILLKEENLNASEIKNVFIAGGFGFFLNKQNAVTAGLIPKEFLDKVFSCANMSLKGAVESLSDISFTEKCKNIIKKCKVIDLACEPSFFDEFASNMFFTAAGD